MAEENRVQWAEDLPPNCPPDAARPPSDEVFYRLARTYPPRQEDFYSQRKLSARPSFPDECRARAVSVFSCVEGCRRVVKLPSHKGKVILKLTLPPKSGLIQQTGRTPEHYSWWRRKDYDPVPCCELVDA